MRRRSNPIRTSKRKSAHADETFHIRTLIDSNAALKSPSGSAVCGPYSRESCSCPRRSCGEFARSRPRRAAWLRLLPSVRFEGRPCAARASAPGWAFGGAGADKVAAPRRPVRPQHGNHQSPVLVPVFSPRSAIERNCALASRSVRWRTVEGAAREASSVTSPHRGTRALSILRSYPGRCARRSPSRVNLVQPAPRSRVKLSVERRP